MQKDEQDEAAQNQIDGMIQIANKEPEFTVQHLDQ